MMIGIRTAFGAQRALLVAGLAAHLGCSLDERNLEVLSPAVGELTPIAGGGSTGSSGSGSEGPGADEMAMGEAEMPSREAIADPALPLGAPTPAPTPTPDGGALGGGMAPAETPPEVTGGGALPAPAEPCDVSAPFEPPTLMADVGSSFDDYGFWLATDGLTAFFASNRTDLGGPGNYDLYRATRPSVDVDFEPPNLLPIVNSPSVERKPVLSPDGLRLFFTSSRAGGDEDIYVATRPNLLSDFEQPGVLAGVSSAEEGDLVHSITNDGRFLYFDRVVAGARREIHVKDLTSSQPPEPVEEINSIHDEGHAVVTDDLLTVYWATTRVSIDPEEGSAESNIWTAQRATPAEPFSLASPVSELNTESGETVHYLSADGCTMYLGSGRTGRQQLWLAQKPTPP